MYINVHKKPFDDPRVRRAINLVLDKQALLDSVGELTAMYPQGWVLRNDSLFAERWEMVNDQPGYRTPTAEDIAEAQRLMQEAGYGDGVEGVDPYRTRHHSLRRGLGANRPRLVAAAFEYWFRHTADRLRGMVRRNGPR